MISACREIIKDTSNGYMNFSKNLPAVRSFYEWIFYVVCVYHIDIEYHRDEKLA